MTSKTFSGTLPKGTYVIRLDQPSRWLIKAILEFDPRLSTEVLREERESLEKGKGTRMYEVGAWSLPLAYGLDAYMSTTKPTVKTTPLVQTPIVPSAFENPQPDYGYLVNYNDKSGLHALLKFFEKDF